MKITVFSDIHGDIYSLEEMARLEKADQYFCLGDLVGYGPHANSCLDFAFDLCGSNNIVFGNHESMFLNQTPFDSCSDLAKRFFYKSFSLYDHDIRLNSLSKIIYFSYGSPVTFTHTLDDIHIYPDTNIVHGDEGFVFIGHSHIQFIKHKMGLVNIVNVGSLGQNRKQKNIASYLNYYPDSNSFEFCSFYSEKSRLIKDMKTLGYESELLDYYR